MIEAVSTLSVQNTSLKAPSQQGASASTQIASVEAPAPVASQNFVVSRIRVDNLRDVAFLEYVSSDSGKVIRQYPNEKQINAYERAGQLEQQAPAQSSESKPSVTPAQTPAVVEKAQVAAVSEPASVSSSSAPQTPSSDFVTA